MRGSVSLRRPAMRRCTSGASSAAGTNLRWGSATFAATDARARWHPDSEGLLRAVLGFVAMLRGGESWGGVMGAGSGDCVSDSCGFLLGDEAVREARGE